MLLVSEQSASRTPAPEAESQKTSEAKGLEELRTGVGSVLPSAGRIQSSSNTSELWPVDATVLLWPLFPVRTDSLTLTLSKQRLGAVWYSSSSGLAWLGPTQPHVTRA